jgi:hypothetical protein
MRILKFFNNFSLKGRSKTNKTGGGKKKKKETAKKNQQKGHQKAREKD